MAGSVSPKLTVIGLSQAGAGWAALALGAGWSVAVYDPDSAVLQAGLPAMTSRVEALVRLGRAEHDAATGALHSLRVGRSLLHAVTDAEWIVDATPDEAGHRQRLLEQVEQVARRAAVVTCATATLHASALAARLRRPERLLAVHALDPVELIPLVEVIPAPLTADACVDDVVYWLRDLGRVPIVLAREVPGHATGRLSAALARECRALVEEGVLSASDVERAVARGPALLWALAGAGPAARDRGLAALLDALQRSAE